VDAGRLILVRSRLPTEELNMRQHLSFSSQFDKIGNSFATRLDCSNCEAERLMMISAIEPASHWGRDEVVYQCTDCGAEKTVIATACRTSVGRSRARI
jgi:hypothetical protein